MQIFQKSDMEEILCFQKKLYKTLKVEDTHLFITGG